MSPQINQLHRNKKINKNKKNNKGKTNRNTTKANKKILLKKVP